MSPLQRLAYLTNPQTMPAAMRDVGAQFQQGVQNLKDDPQAAINLALAFGGGSEAAGSTGAAEEVTSAEARQTRAMGPLAKQRVRYHGTIDPIQQLGPMRGYGELYGPGLYTTSSKGVAEGYAGGQSTPPKPGAEPKGNIYRIYETGPVKLAHVDELVPDSVIERLAKKYPEEGLWDDYLQEPGSTTLPPRVGDVLQGRGLGAKTSTEVNAIHQHFIEEMQKEGYTGVTHTGGANTGTYPHKVNIYWNPQQDVRLRSIEGGAPPPTIEASPASGEMAKKFQGQRALSKAIQTHGELASRNLAREQMQAYLDAIRAPGGRYMEALRSIPPGFTPGRSF